MGWGVMGELNTYNRVAYEDEAIEHWLCPLTFSGETSRCIARRCPVWRFSGRDELGYSLDWQIGQVVRRRGSATLSPTDREIEEAQKNLDKFYLNHPRKGYCGLGGTP